MTKLHQITLYRRKKIIDIKINAMKSVALNTLEINVLVEVLAEINNNKSKTMICFD